MKLSQIKIVNLRQYIRMGEGKLEDVEREEAPNLGLFGDTLQEQRKFLQNYQNNLHILDLQESEIRNKYIKAKPFSNISLITYQQFAAAFPPPTIYQAYKDQNLSIIDMHLRYNQYIYQRMAIYKWAPSILFAFITRFSLPGLIFPLIWTKAIDHYFKDFFIWRESNKKIISIRKQFITKLSKPKNKIRRILKYKQIKENEKKSNEKPLKLNVNDVIKRKYMKFGEVTQYLFHASDSEYEESSVCMTPLFQNYINIKSVLNWDSLFKLEPFTFLYSHFSDLRDQFLEFKKIKSQKNLPSQIFIKDFKPLIEYQDIKPELVCNLSNQVQMRIRRLLQIWKYHQTENIFMSGFSVTQLMHLNKHYDLLEPQRFNLQSNAADYLIFYGTLALPKLLHIIIKRSVRM